MTAKHFIVATAGHVDHGKSALVKALTGTDPDRLPEEKARGITIDLGFAHLELPAPLSRDEPTSLTPHAPPTTYHLGIVDVPGHEDFVKNMVAGVGSIDLALFVIAADDGWMPQTEEHLQILNYLGVTHAVVVLTKVDLVESDEEAVVERIREQLRGTPFGGSPIVKTSVVTGRGLDELKSALVGALAAMPAPRDINKPRLPVDRVFTLRGIGTVITGTLNGGTLRRGQDIIIQPTGQKGRIRNLQTHNQDVESIGPGTRTALNLPDLAIAAKGRSVGAAEGVQRGEVVTLSELGAPTNTVDALLEKSARLINSKSHAARPVKDSTLVRVHHGSGNFSARVLLLESGTLQPGQRALVQLRFAAPVFVFAGDRFIVRDGSEQSTLAGGIVLDPEAGRRQFRSRNQREFLEQRGQAPEDVGTFAASQLRRDRAVRRSVLLVKSCFSVLDIAKAIEQLVAQKKAILTGDWVADAAWWNSLVQKARDAIQTEHRLHPDRVGIALNDLRKAVQSQLPAPELLDMLLGELSRHDYIQTGVAVRHQAHRPALPPQLQAAGAKLRSALAARPLEPPSRKELAPDSVSQQALRFLLQTGEAIELGDEVVLLTEPFLQAKERIRSFLSQKGAATVSELRQVISTSRRIMVPLLERLDREGVTLRQGDQRVLKIKAKG